LLAKVHPGGGGEMVMAAQQMTERAENIAHQEDTPAYRTLKENGVLCTKYRRSSVEDLFTGVDLMANTDAWANIKTRALWCGYTPGLCCVYSCTHTEMFVPAGHVGLLMDDQNRYLFASPGMHNISSMFVRKTGAPKPLRGHIKHGNRTIVIVDQGFIGYAEDNGQPLLLPPGIHIWTSETLDFKNSLPLNEHLILLGPYTLLTVDEGPFGVVVVLRQVFASVIEFSPQGTRR